MTPLRILVNTVIGQVTSPHEDNRQLLNNFPVKTAADRSTNLSIYFYNRHKRHENFFIKLCAARAFELLSRHLNSIQATALTQQFSPRLYASLP